MNARIVSDITDTWKLHSRHAKWGHFEGHIYRQNLQENPPVIILPALRAHELYNPSYQLAIVWSSHRRQQPRVSTGLEAPEPKNRLKGRRNKDLRFCHD
jgi:hypothetical protein